MKLPQSLPWTAATQGRCKNAFLCNSLFCFQSCPPFGRLSCLPVDHFHPLTMNSHVYIVRTFFLPLTGVCGHQVLTSLGDPHVWWSPVTSARDYVVPNPRQFDLRADKFSSKILTKGAAAVQRWRAPRWHCASAGPALFLLHHTTRRLHTCTPASAGCLYVHCSCACCQFKLVTFSTGIT